MSRAYHQCGVGSRLTVKIKKGCTRLASAGDKTYQLLSMVGSSLRVLRILPPHKLVAMIYLKYYLKWR